MRAGTLKLLPQATARQQSLTQRLDRCPNDGRANANEVSAAAAMTQRHGLWACRLEFGSLKEARRTPGMCRPSG